MIMTTKEQIITVAIIAAASALTRFLPFLVFNPSKETPRFVAYLGKVLPAAVFGMLVVYCLRGMDFTSELHAIPEIVSVLLVCVVHIWQRKMLLSIASGTICYMILINIL